MKSVKLCFLLFSLIALILPAPALAASASLTITPATSTVAVNGNATLSINVNSGGTKTVGTDVIVKYDTSKLDFVSITKGNVYSSYSTEVHYADTGTVSLSGFVGASEIQTGVAVNGVFATIVFKGKSAGAANVSFHFTSGNSADSNVVEAGGSGTDILTSATGASVTVGGAVTPTAAPTAVPTYAPTNPTSPTYPGVLPNAASLDPTIVVVFLGLTFLVLGGIGIFRSFRN